jgi:hypothetical protein
MKKKTLFWVLGVVLLAAFIYFKFVNGWLTFTTNTDTPDQFLNFAKPNNYIYQNDKRSLLRAFDSLSYKKKGFFNNTSISDPTNTIIIDTIVYSPDFKKLGVMIIVKYIGRNDGDWHYNSTCYLGIKRGGYIDLEAVGPNFIYSDSKRKASFYIRTACFRNFVVKNSDIYLYNLNDKRFWTSQIWKEYF